MTSCTPLKKLAKNCKCVEKLLLEKGGKVIASLEFRPLGKNKGVEKVGENKIYIRITKMMSSSAAGGGETNTEGLIISLPAVVLTKQTEKSRDLFPPRLVTTTIAVNVCACYLQSDPGASRHRRDRGFQFQCT